MTSKSASQQLILRVAEAKSKDVGRKIARIDPQYFKDLNVEIGDIAKLKGVGGLKEKVRETVVKIMPLYPEDRGREIVQIDGITRENAQVGLDEKMILEKVSSSEANIVVLAPLTGTRALSSEGEDKEYITKLLDGTPVIKNDTLRITFFGSRAQDFLVEDTDPAGAIIITSSTVVKIKGEAQGKKG